jgi:hypothetical protein
MLHQINDPRVTRELAVMSIVFPLVGLAICTAIFGLYLWRLHHFEHSVATIEAVWEEDVYRRGAETITMAELSFSRTALPGKTVACRHSFEIGTPRDAFAVGDKLDIVPATGTCQRADIIGRVE